MVFVDPSKQWNDKKTIKHFFLKKICCPEQRAGWASICFLSTIFSSLAVIAWWELKINIQLKTFDLNYDSGKYFGIIADIHLDLDLNSTHCQNGSSRDGAWIIHHSNDYGGRHCDSSLKLLDLTLSELKSAEHNTNSFEFITILGDNSGHFTEGAFNSLEGLSQLNLIISKYFPSTPVYFTLGNHDLSTIDSKIPENPESWYKLFWDSMSKGLQKDKSEVLGAMKTFNNYGFYKIEHDKSLWIVSINTNIFLTRTNFSDEVINTQLSWLNETLIKAHLLESVSILLLGHTSPEIELTKLSSWYAHKKMTWRNECITKFNEIVAPHWQIIKLQFYGHQHTDSWFVKTFLNNDYISHFKIPSVSMSDHGQPSFSVGIVNEKWELLDILHYFCPVEMFTRSNKDPVYSFHYSFKQQNFQYKEKYSVINGPLLKKLTDRIIHFDDGMQTYTNRLMNIYQLSFKPHISPYGMYCVITENSSIELEECLVRYL